MLTDYKRNLIDKIECLIGYLEMYYIGKPLPHELLSVINEANLFIEEFRKYNAMNWLPIDPDNLPEGEVLAARFGDGFNFKHLGYLSLNQRCIIMCIKNNSILTGCTHYIDINKFDI